MKKFISLASNPGKTGQYFYNSFFNYYNISAIYEPYKTANLTQSILDAVSDRVEGVSITMPFKKDIIPLLDNSDNLVSVYQSCNTVKIINGKLNGYNCDIEGVIHVSQNINVNDRISILGDGAIGSMFAKYLESYNHTIYTRSNNWDDRIAETNVVINCTPCRIPYSSLPVGTRLVIDMSVTKNYLEEQCSISNIRYVSGREFYKCQFLRQFEIYTGIKPQSEVYDIFAEKFHQSI